MRRTIVIIYVSLFFLSCEKKELPVPKYDRGDLITREVAMGVTYKNQVWFSLHDNKIVSTNLKTDWDIAFEASPEGSRIYLNGAQAMKIYKTDAVSFDQIVDTNGLAAHERADAPSGNRDSTAFGNWQEKNTVYVINRGYNDMGLKLGFYKLKLISVSSSGYTFEYGDIYGKQVWQGSVTKAAGYNTVSYSFSSHKQVNIEPMRLDYDLCFTQYTHLFLDPLQYYQVTGVLNNPASSRVARIRNKTFNEISTSDTLGLTFDTGRNAIGYDWKVFDLNTNQYTVNAKICYILRDNKGFYYKLHFVDFYNSQGLKGFPKFEFVKL